MKKILYLLGLCLLTNMVFGQGTKVKGVVKNSADSVIAFYKNGFDAITREKDGTRYKARLNQEGEFEIVLPEFGIRQWVIEQGDKFTIVNLCNGHDLNLMLDFTAAFENRISANGPNAAEVNVLGYLEKYKRGKYGADFYKIVREQNPVGALKMRKERADFLLAELEAYHAQHKLSTEYYQWLKTFYKYEPFERVLVEHLNGNEQRSDSNYVALLTSNGFNDDYAAKHSREYNDLANYYLHYKMNGSKYPLKIVDFFDFGTKDNLSGLTKQVFLTQQIMFATKGKDSLYQAMLQKYKAAVNDQQLLQIVADQRAAYLAKLAESNQSKENVSQSASLNEIFKKYKGKVVYLDFWASWCEPCKSEMPNSNALKKKLKGQDVVFLYFAYKDQKENWLAARKELEIEGEHYLLNPALIKEANELFGITGIPHYVIIGKDGSMVEKKAARPLQAYEQLFKLARAAPSTN